jgi:hypothetical protein
MNGTHDIDDTAASDPGGAFDPRAAASLLEQTTKPASRTSVALTHRGRAALNTYTATIRRLLDGL